MKMIRTARLILLWSVSLLIPGARSYGLETVRVAYP